jgi:hypothetical protein
MKNLMRKIFILLPFLLATPALAAVKISNLSGYPQRVSYESAGTVQTKVIAPNNTAYFHGSEGMLSIDVASQQVKATAATPGLLSRALGNLTANNRNSMIPTATNDSFVIWPDGRLLLQRRRETGFAR